MRKFYMDSNVRTLLGGANEIRIRSGLFNYNEATLDLTPYSDDMKEATKQLVKTLKKEGFAMEDIDHFSITEEDKQTLRELMGGLLEANMIFEKDGDMQAAVTDTVLGSIKDALVPEDLKNSNVLFISDCDYCIKMAKELSEQIKLDINYAGRELIEKIVTLDLTTNIDALKTEKALAKLDDMLGEYDAYVISLKHIHMKFIRNLNRYVLDKQKTMTVGMIDGPFVTVFSISPPSTGCAECFEKRILARLEDHQLYERYVDTDDFGNTENNPANLLLASMLTNLVISEAFLIKHYSMTKFEGRVLSVFIPTLEIQTQDLLRIPHCPACGYVSKAQFEEINLESRVMVDQLLNKDITS